MRKKVIIGLGGVVLALMLAGCGSGTSSITRDQAVTNQQMDIYQANQPVPTFNWSQYRQTLIDILQAQVHGVATTTFFYHMGVAKPDSCPSIGFPIPASTQLTNGKQVVPALHNNDSAVVDQAEPNGTYSGPTTGTWVICVGPSGARYPRLWEGWVDAVGAAAHWDPVTQQEVVDGTPTVAVTTK